MVPVSIILCKHCPDKVCARVSGHNEAPKLNGARTRARMVTQLGAPRNGQMQCG